MARCETQGSTTSARAQIVSFPGRHAPSFKPGSQPANWGSAAIGGNT